MRTPVLQATLATDGLIGTAAGPRDPGTAYVLAHHYAGRALGAQGAWGFVRGGMGAVSAAAAAAARAAGATLRTGSAVARIGVRDGRAAHIELRDGTTISAAAILVNADPKTLFLRLLERGDVPPELLARATAWRSNGVSVKINLALGELPGFPRPAGYARAAAPPRDDPRRTVARLLAGAPTTTRSASASRASRCSSASCKRRPIRRSHRRENTSSRSSRSTSRTTGRDRPWEPGDRDAIADRVVAQLAAYAPNLPGAIEHRQVLAPPDLEATLGLAGGHIFHGELLPGQIYERRFGVRTGIDGLYLCGSGTHPGGCVSGFPGRRAAAAAIADARRTVAGR